ncbi:MAG: DUF4838 domain-containing protein [Kiritimatiellae bacterium]|nr:DUF4838 domain-containing protein [Kiritimatiellia bacterium]
MKKSLLSLALAFASAATCSGVTLDASSEIVLRSDAPYATRLAAEELNFFLSRVFGSPLAVVSAKTPGRAAIVLGGEDARFEPLGRDGFLIEATDDALRIAGRDEDVADVASAAFLPDEAPYQPCFARGTLFGVYEFLERHAGVRMYFPGELGTCIPRMDRIDVAPSLALVRPAFSVRRYGYADGPVAKELLEGRSETDFKRLNWYRLRMETEHLACCHGAKTHCLSPATWDAIFTNACDVLAENLGGTFDAMPKDGFTWLRHCNCEWCAKNIPFSDTDTRYATDLVWRRTAELASRIQERFPAARVSQMSYIPYAGLPTNDLPSNIDVFVARRGPWADGTEIGEREIGEVRAWREKLGRPVSLWNYPDKVACWRLEMKDVPQFAPRAWARYYAAVAPFVTGAFAESESDRWLYNYLNYWIFSRVCWNPRADTEALLGEHHRLMFGPAAPEMAEFFGLLEERWMAVVSKPVDTPLGPGVCDAPDGDELRRSIYTPEILTRLDALLAAAAGKVAPGSLEARRIGLFRRECFAPLEASMNEALRVGLIADIHIAPYNDNSSLKRALRLFDERRADAVIAAGDLTEFGLLSQLKEVAAAWNEVFPCNRRSDGRPVARLFHYGDHDTELNWRVRRREVVEKGLLGDYIPQMGLDVAWERAFGEHFEPVVRRTIKGCEFTLLHFIPDGMKERFPQNLPQPSPARLHVFSQHRVYRGLLARPGRGDEIGWDDGATIPYLSNRPDTVAVCGHAHISAANDTSFRPGAQHGDFTAVQIPSLFYQIETWLPKPKGDHASRQVLFLTFRAGRVSIERLDAATGEKVGPDWTVTLR